MGEDLVRSCGVKPSDRRTSAAEALARAAKARRQETIEKLERGKAAALRMIAENDGVYPSNGGRLSQAEVCRLSDVDPTILSGAAHRDTTRDELNDWLKRVAGGLPKGKRRTRNKITGQVAAWKALYEEALDSFGIVELELSETRQRLAECEADLAALRASVSR